MADKRNERQSGSVGEKKQRGRPKTLEDRWAKVTVVLLNRQIVYLDQLAVDIRSETAKAVNRAELLRELLDFSQKDPETRKRLMDKFGKTR